MVWFHSNKIVGGDELKDEPGVTPSILICGMKLKTAKGTAQITVNYF